MNRSISDNFWKHTSRRTHGTVEEERQAAQRAIMPGEAQDDGKRPRIFPDDDSVLGAAGPPLSPLLLLPAGVCVVRTWPPSPSGLGVCAL